MGVKEDIEAAAAAELPSSSKSEALERAVAATGRHGGPKDRREVGREAAQVLELLKGATASHMQGTASNGIANLDKKGRSPLELTLRLIRNAAAEPTALEELVAHGLFAELAESLHLLALSGPCPETTVGAQLLANLAVGAGALVGISGSFQATFFPEIVLDLAAVQRHSVQGPLSLALFFLSKDSKDFCQSLLSVPSDPSADKRSLLRLLLNASEAGEGGGEDLARLLGIIAYQEGQLGSLLTLCRRLSANRQLDAPDDPSLTAWSYELELLQLLSESSSTCFSAASSPNCRAAMQSLVDFLRENAKELSADPESLEAVARLRMGLQLLRSLTSSEENADPSASRHFSNVIRMLCEAGAARLLLAMLKALPPIMPRGAAAARQSSETASTSSEPIATMDPSGDLSDEAAALPKRSMFHGYRSYLVAVLGNMAFRQPRVQDAVTALGGVELLLAQCQVDDESPMVREWALWAVRNLTEGSAEAQQRIRNLEVCKAVDSPELQAMGKELEYDPSLGKMRLADRTDGKGSRPRPPHQSQS